MPQSLKIATCCYCGTRAALRLDKARHELVCRACGAPLHELKQMPRPKAHRPKRDVQAMTGQMAPTRPKPKPKPKKERKRDKPRYRKGLGRKILDELWDMVEDVFD